MSMFALALAAGQEKQTVAVYMAGEEPKGALGSHKMVGGELVKAISRSEKYLAVNRTDDILKLLAKEHSYARSGAVSDDQIRDIGRQFGVQYLCIVEISEVKGGSFYVDTRLVDVVTAQTQRSATAASSLSDSREMMSVAQEVVKELLADARTAPAQQTKPTPALTGFIDDKAGMDMVFVQGGTFTMGCTAEQVWKYCSYGKWDVTISDFYIGKYEVTQKQWVSVMGKNPSKFKGDNLPVQYVSWEDAQIFISKLNAVTGRKYRLPTEAEWEYAARGGAENKGYMFVYAGSNNLNEVAWHKGNSGKKTQPVGTKKPNELGIYDMSGNVAEWVNDWMNDWIRLNRAYGYDIYGENIDPKGPTSGDQRVVRGLGNWNYDFKESFQTSHRECWAPSTRAYVLGLRLALSP